MSVAIIIPAYNEGKTVAAVVNKAKKYGKVIVVNDASRDDTAAVAKRAGALVISHKTNMGLGASLRTGFGEAIRRKYDVIITIDADGQHNPDEIPKFIRKIRDCEFVLGSRDLLYYPFLKKFGNFFLNFFTNFIAGTNLKDTESGFRAFRRRALEKLYLRAERYEIAVEIIFEVGRNHISYTNVEIESPLYRRGVKFSDGVNNFRYLLQRRKRDFSSYVEDFGFVMRNTARSLVERYRRHD